MFLWGRDRLSRLDLGLSTPLANCILAENDSWTEELEREQDGDIASREEVAHYLGPFAD